MGMKEEKLWTELERKAQEEEERCGERESAPNYLKAVEVICKYGVDRAKTIRDTFPFYTMHDEIHICNVMRLMGELLGDKIKSLTRDEMAMLVMAACCHDIGMSYTVSEKEALLNNRDAIRRYLDRNPSEYMKAYAGGGEEPELTNEIEMNFFRSIHHERVRELLQKIEWPRALRGRIDKSDLIRVCRSHGEDVSELAELDSVHSLDIRFCAILLRLADILDFDDSRAPQAIYEYNEFDRRTSYSEQFSEEEWEKHLSSAGFSFKSAGDRSYPYLLDYTAECYSIKIEQKIRSYLDWVDQELNDCGKMLRRFAGRWNDFVLPAKVKPYIQNHGYVSDPFQITLDQEQVMELFVGENLYSDPAVFVRELIQNAIDAVRTRKQLDRSLPPDWTGQIKIRTWSERGNHWFRIEDNGIGMTKDVIQNYFLKVGRSYYNSDEFRQVKHRCKANPDYTPVSRFGIGILSCFMGDKKTNQVEVSTKHFSENGIYYPSLRLSMCGINGYYYMADREEGHTAEPMQGVTDEEKEPYRNEPGTVIAVRTNLYQTGKYRGFREIIDQYVQYPEVPIHFESAEEGSYDYPTEKEFMEGIHSLKEAEGSDGSGGVEFLISDEDMEKLKKRFPELVCRKRPGVIIHCDALDDYMKSPYLTGASLYAEATGEFEPIKVKLWEMETEMKAEISFFIQHEEIFCKITFRFLSEQVAEQIEKRIETFFPGINIDQWKIQPEKDFMKLYKSTDSEDESALNTYIKFRYSVTSYQIGKLQHLQSRLEESEGGLHRKIFDGFRKSSFILSHNGIICKMHEGRHFILGVQVGSISTLIILKDKYRPVINLSRDNVEELNLEAACALGILEESAPGRFNMDDLTSHENYLYIPQKNYWQQIADHPEWEALLRFDTEEGEITTDELRKTVDERGFQDIYSQREHYLLWDKSIYPELYFAFLQKNYKVLFKQQEHRLGATYRTVFTIGKKEQTDDKKEDEIFPPRFCFKISKDAPQYDELKNCIKIGKSCNKEHRLIQFLIKNGRVLREQVPGLWNKMLRVLLEERGNTLVSEVNLILSDLRKITDLGIHVPDHLFLSDKDMEESDSDSSDVRALL